MITRCTRRSFLKGAFALAAATSLPSFADDRRVLAITIDDFNWAEKSAILDPQKRNQALLDSLGKARVKAALFVCGMYVDPEVEKEGNRLLSLWDAQGHCIGNHTYSHWFYPQKPIKDYQDDILKCEKILASFKNFQKLFRFPFLKEGRTLEQRNAMRAFLKQNGYRNGHVTIDTSDWLINQRLQQKLEKDPNTDLIPYRQYYIEHLHGRAALYTEMADAIFPKPIPHTMLLHHNTLNALFLGDVITSFRDRGWTVVNATDVFRDPVFDREPDVLPAGNSLMVALAIENGKLDALLQDPREDSDHDEKRMNELGL